MNTYLSVCDGNDIGWDVGRHVTGLSLNDWQSGQGSTPEVFVHLGGTLKQTGVEVEHITGVGLTARGTTQQKRHLTVGNGLQIEDGVKVPVTLQLHISALKGHDPP